MSLGKSLLVRLGTLSRTKTEATARPDTFELRLRRIGLRDARVPVRPILFRTRPARLAV